DRIEPVGRRQHLRAHELARHVAHHDPLGGQVALNRDLRGVVSHDVSPLNPFSRKGRRNASITYRPPHIPISSAFLTVFITMRIEAASTIVPLTFTEPRPSASALS